VPEVELYSVRLAFPGVTARWARRCEDEGWDGIGIGDSQNLAADAFTEMALAAAATTGLGLSTAVTNPLTRHPAVTASCIATIQAESGGRASLGIGRGDSALAHLGLAPVPVGVLAHQVDQLRSYLHGEEVAFEEPVASSQVASSASLAMAGGPTASRLEWLPADLPPVPVDVFATGPRVIALGATRAERVTFAVGSDPGRLRWAVETARDARRAAGQPDGQPMGAFVPIVVHPDMATARALVSGAAASFARFSVMHGTVVGPADESQRATLAGIHAAYDMSAHFTAGSPQSAALTDEVIDAFCVAGPVGYCVDRLTEMAEVGLSRLFVNAGVPGADQAEMQASRRRLVDEVLPALR
jgi:5,10-methylenetetrahydromethanopterin reductase